MNQDSFRQLLSTSKTTPGPSSGFPTRQPKKVSHTDSISGFKPRKLAAAPASNPTSDRAAAELRSYLGDSGESEHKGLNFALLAQNRARLQEQDTVDDDVLEDAFASSSKPSTSSNPPDTKKKSRADLLKQLKESRGNAASKEPVSEDAKPTKFKPIASGFKPIGETDKKKKKKKIKAEGELDDDRKKKKRKLDDTAPAEPLPAPPPAALPLPKLPPLPADDLDPDADIFADAGDYEGIPSDSDESMDDAPTTSKPSEPPTVPRRGWFDEKEPTPPPVPNPISSVADSSPAPAQPPSDDSENEEPPKPTRLEGLSSSVLPNIRSFLDAERAANPSLSDVIGARKARKAEKRAAKQAEAAARGEEINEAPRGGKGKDAKRERKLDKDYKK
ncbi:hypothetical protein DL96DRAFT_1705070 [Flagelloscypha sp. PMI_526]|nr:hypothetical protein DL96DRAFT_1705070 [Flagelloscypha sp. PMI_526]